MRQVGFQFEIKYDLLCGVCSIFEHGQCNPNLKEEIKELMEYAYFRPNRDFHYDLELILNKYYTYELIKYDKTFKQVNNFLLSAWKDSLPQDQKSLKYLSRNALNLREFAV